MINELKKHLIEFEGIVLKPYKCTAGKITIGIGRNLDVIDLGFNMGVPTLSTFRNMLECLKQKDWDGAAKNLLDSKYAKQVGRRAIYNAHLLETAGTNKELPTKVNL